MPSKSKVGQGQASSDSWRRTLSTLDVVRTVINKTNLHPVRRCSELLFLGASYSSISQFSLSPVYGSIPASIHHKNLIITTILLAYAAKILYRAKFVESRVRWVQYIPIVATAVPPMQSLLFKQSAWLGPLWGPSVTEICTFAPILFLIVLATGLELDNIGINRFGKGVGAIVSVSLMFVVIEFLRGTTTEWMVNAMGYNLMFTRAGLQHAIAVLYAVKFPSRKSYPATLLWALSLGTNYHLLWQARTAALNETLLNHGYALVARNESLTGYISVLDNVNDAFRVMRCDHSLLGGEWINTPRTHASGLKEPIYAVFTMLEAVRLVVPPDSGSHFVSDTEKEALVVGLGIGTTPAALIAHGIQTTIVEIDPLVHRYASEYFRLPTNHTAVIKDAVAFVDEAGKVDSERSKYDYVIHDVFTGGAEPAALFTQEFLEGLSLLLKPDGVIAINYAGDLLLPSATLVVNTIGSVFPSCRMFREEALPDEEGLTKDFTNMVMFCGKAKGTLSFRTPTEADFLGSQARRRHLLPKYEIKDSYFDRADSSEKPKVLRRGQTQILEFCQQESALGHWKIMRSVLPDFVWENW